MISDPDKEAAPKALLAISFGNWSLTTGKVCIEFCSPKILSCSCAAGR